jgi:glutamate-1-semialdehyde aminotransferase
MGATSQESTAQLGLLHFGKVCRGIQAMNLDESFDWWERAGDVNAGGFATLSKNPDRFAFGVSPILLESGNGGHVWSIDGDEFVDTIAALGPILLGYNWPSITELLSRAIREIGSPSFSLGHPAEVMAAEAIAGNVPCVDSVRFCKNGADATQAAIRLARAFTGRRHVLCSGYHGHHDWYISSTDKNGGVLAEIGKYTHQFAWEDYENLLNLVNTYSLDLACIILEVPPLEWGHNSQEITDFLVHVQDLASHWGALFILDEVVTGFRYGLGGASSMYGVTPDLVCFGKGMANGWPIAALGGDRSLMDYFRGGGVFLSTTNGGDVFSLIATIETISVLENSAHLERLWSTGRQIGNGLSRLLETYNIPATLLGNDARMVIKWRDDKYAFANEIKTLWLAESIKYGVLFGGPIFPMVAHTDQDIIQILTAAEAGFISVQQGIDNRNLAAKLPCDPIEDVFSQRYNRESKVSALSGV